MIITAIFFKKSKFISRMIFFMHYPFCLPSCNLQWYFHSCWFVHFHICSMKLQFSFCSSCSALSHWCIFHRKKAHLVVETWDKQLRELPKEQSVPFLYLANDIIQNSKRRGEEFVSEFWNILPGALKNVIEKGDSKAQSVVSRLVCCLWVYSLSCMCLNRHW